MLSLTTTFEEAFLSLFIPISEKKKKRKGGKEKKYNRFWIIRFYGFRGFVISYGK